MYNEQCNIVSDLLPLYVDGLTSEETNLVISKHLEECSECKKEYEALKTEINTSVDNKYITGVKEINYLKKINLYQRINLVLGAIISFILGACIPVLKVGIPIFFRGYIPDYYLARLQIAWHIGLLKMTFSGIVVCILYLIIMFIVKKRIKK